jgi:predicted ATPase
VLVTTHSPDFLNSVRANELWALDRGPDGFTRVHRASEVDGINEMMNAGAQLGWLWSAGYLSAADPLESV